MNEREFDDIFKDKLGDELPFDFHSGDWQAAAQELDKVLPIVPLVAPNPALSPVSKILGWHKWAAAAAVLAVVSQGWLLTKLYDVSDELNTIKQQNSVAAVQVEKQSENAPNAKNTEGVVIRDTIIKYVEVLAKVKEESTYKMGIENGTTQNGTIAQNDDTKALLNEVNQLKKAIKEKNKIIETQRNEVNSAIARIEVKNDIKADNIVNNGSKILDKASFDKKEDNNAINNNPIIAQNNSSIEKINTPNNSVNALDKNADAITTKSDVAEASKERLTLGNLNNLPSLGFSSVKSNFKETLEMNAEDLYLLHSSRRNIIKPLPDLSGWKVGANALSVVTNLEYKDGKVEKHENIVSNGVNARVMYDVNKNWRASADINIWKESYEPHIDLDSIRHNSPFPTPSPDYKLSKVSFNSKNAQIRIGADYLLPNKTLITPFLGFGLAYKWKTKKDIAFEYKNNDPNKPPLPPFAIQDDIKDQSPYYFSLRAGVEGKIYKRLSWSANITSQLRLNSKTNQIWGSQVGLAYAL
jgi:hypothetical protein